LSCRFQPTEDLFVCVCMYICLFVRCFCPGKVEQLRRLWSPVDVTLRGTHTQKTRSIPLQHSYVGYSRTRLPLHCSNKGLWLWAWTIRTLLLRMMMRRRRPLPTSTQRAYEVCFSSKVNWRLARPSVPTTWLLARWLSRPVPWLGSPVGVTLCGDAHATDSSTFLYISRTRHWKRHCHSEAICDG
jgi:hypothetical protein